MSVQYDNGNGKKSITEYFRWITPVLVTISIFYLGNLKSTMDSIDEKLFKHLTNADLHMSRTVVVDKETFAIYQMMWDRQMTDIREGLNGRIDSLRISMDRVISLLDKKK